MEIGQKIIRHSEGMTITSRHGSITEVWEIKSINEEEKYCECYVREDSSAMSISGERVVNLNFDFVNKHLIK